jgi:lipid-binding SYLF domain-containing protein
MPRILSLPAACLLAVALFGAGCNTAPKNQAQKDALRADADVSVQKMTAQDASLRAKLDSAYGHAVFPEIGKGGLIVGGSYGRGVVYEQGQFIGYADLTKVSVGLQAGGQSFRELILFQNKEALDDLRFGKLKFDATASAVAVNAGAAATADYRNGVLVFAQTIGGLMAEASVGGQEFGFVPAGGGKPTTRPSE